MIEVRLSRLENMRRNEKTLPTQSLTIPDFPNHINRDQESRCLENFNQDLVLPQYFKLDQSQILDKLTSFLVKKIELDYECDPDL